MTERRIRLVTEAFASHFTAKGLEEFFEIGPDDDAEAILAEEFEFSGPIESAELTNFFITSGNARANADLRFEFGFSVYEEWSFLFLDGELLDVIRRRSTRRSS